MVAPEMEKVARTQAGHILVAKVNTESLPSLSQQFGILSIPTMMVFLHGREIGRTTGARPAEAIRDFVAQAIAA